MLGEVRTIPYLRHVSGPGCSSAKESWRHLLAKKVLCEYLNAGGSVILDTGNVVPTLLEWKTEVSHNDRKCIYDIGGCDAEGNLQFGIEILYKHRTTNTQSRILPWIETKAEEVIELLVKVSISPESITLKDYKEIATTDDSDSEEVIHCNCEYNNSTRRCKVCKSAGQKRCKFCRCFTPKWIIDSHRMCIDCDIQDHTNKTRGWRTCIRCRRYSISSKASPFVVMCYDCQDKYSPSEKDAANKITGWRQCSKCHLHEIHPTRPSYCKLCLDCYRK
jgi:hypothetical protein